VNKWYMDIKNNYVVYDHVMTSIFLSLALGIAILHLSSEE
jgi:hypothetical protein